MRTLLTRLRVANQIHYPLQTIGEGTFSFLGVADHTPPILLCYPHSFNKAETRIDQEINQAEFGFLMKEFSVFNGHFFFLDFFFLVD